MIRHWLTVHWPHPIDPNEDHDWYVYLQHQYRDKGEQLSPGDMVVFYETAKGRPHQRKDGRGLVELRKGRQAVIGIAKISGQLRASTTSQNVKSYEDGTQLNWAWEVPCTVPSWGKPVPYSDVKDILKKGNMRIRAGLVEIDQGQFEKLARRLGLGS